MTESQTPAQIVAEPLAGPSYLQQAMAQGQEILARPSELLAKCHQEELESLRHRVLEQRREIARLHAERDKAWETDTIKVQYWRSSCYNGIVGRREQFALRGRRVLGTTTTQGRYGAVGWLAAFGGGVAKNGTEAIKLLVQHDTEAGAIAAGRGVPAPGVKVDDPGV